MVMNSLLPMRKVVYVICIWHEPQHDQATFWRGYLETAAGQRLEFDTLAELNRLLCELGGWIDPPTHMMPQEAGSG